MWGEWGSDVAMLVLQLGRGAGGVGVVFCIIMDTRGGISILIPCLNEQATIGQVIDDFRRELPDATVFVFDNNSTDRTRAIALEHGAAVVPVPRQGKGHVVQAMFRAVQADCCVMVDGDGTYPASSVHDLLTPLREGAADIVVGTRVATRKGKAFRRFHRFGNALVARLIRWIWGTNLTDIMSGYRAFNRDVVNSLPLLSVGFEIETEMTLQALDKGYVIIERPVPYGERPKDSVSKLNTIRDGFRVLALIVNIFRDYKPLTFFGVMGIFWGLVSLVPGYVLVRDIIADHTIDHLGAAILCTGCVLLMGMCIHIGIILNSLCWKLKEFYSIERRSRASRSCPGQLP